MHIVILSDFETQTGGAAICATRLANALLACGQQVSRIVSYPDGKRHDWNTVALAPSLLAWGALRKLPNLGMPYATWELRRRLGPLLNALKPEVINVHNIHGALNNAWSIDLLRICQQSAPVVWTLHDMWSFTGRCAFSYDCEKYLSGCDATCPTPAEYPALAPERISAAWQQRAVFFQDSQRVCAVSPSAWLAREACKGFWRGRRLEVIPYSLPLDIFKPIGREIARQALGLDLHSPLLLLAGVSLEDRRKGVRLAYEAIEKITRRPVSLLTFGASAPDIEIPGVEIHHLGFIEDERLKVLAYNSADIFIHPSLADNLPNMIIESLACGTPVVAFPVGGVPELVSPGETGWLVQELNADSLARSIESALSELDAGLRFESASRRIAEAEFSADLQAQRYLALFESLV